MAPPLSTLERGGLEETPASSSFPSMGEKNSSSFFSWWKKGKEWEGTKCAFAAQGPFLAAEEEEGGGGEGGFFTLTVFAQIIPGENPRVFALPVCLGGFFGGKFVLPISRNFPNRIHAYILGYFFVKVWKKEKERKTRKEKEEEEKSSHGNVQRRKEKVDKWCLAIKNVGNHGVWRERELLLLRGKKPDFRFSQKKIHKKGGLS